MSDLQRINVKIGLDGPRDLDWDLLLAVFGRWRLEEGEEIVDLADYHHVPDGPNVLLISHRWQFGVDDGDGWRGFFFSTRKGLEGSLEDRVRKAVADLLAKIQRLLAEPETPEGVVPNFERIGIVINDRVRFPNQDAAAGEIEPAIRSLLDRLLDGRYSLEREPDADRRLGYLATSPADGIDLERALAVI